MLTDKSTDSKIEQINEIPIERTKNSSSKSKFYKILIII